MSDFNKDATKAYEILYETFPAFEMQGISKRAVFIIDKNGDVQHIEICATPGDLPDFNAMQQVLNRLN